MSTQSKRIVRAYLLLFVLLAALSFLSLAVGSVRVSAADILVALGGKEGTDMTRHILFDIRLPRMLAALILGGALSVSGFLLQTFFSNPIAGPFVLGISSGAKLARFDLHDPVSRTGTHHEFLGHDRCGFSRCHGLHGLRAGGLKKASSDDHVSGKRDHDRIYLFGGNGFYRDLRR